MHADFIRGYGKINNPDTSNYLKYWKRLSNDVDPTAYKINHTITGENDIKYVPPDIYYSIIEPTLNDYTMSKAYKDKNSFDRLYGAELFPATILRNMQGAFYNKDYKILQRKQVVDILEDLNINYKKIIIKPSLITGRGLNVMTADLQHDKITLEFLQKHYGHDYLIQEFVEQHNFFSQFGIAKMNCLRINTYRSVKTEEIIVHGMDIGINPQSPEEHRKYGINYVGVNNGGDVGPYSLNTRGNLSKKLHNSAVLFSEFDQVPEINSLKMATLEIASKTPYHRLLGFDVIIDSLNRTYIIEVNFDCLGIPQYVNGAMFKEYTNEIIEYCIEQKSKANFVFTH
jgi:hypothetical protein